MMKTILISDDALLVGKRSAITCTSRKRSP
jgi:hypothetical protein